MHLLLGGDVRDPETREFVQTADYWRSDEARVTYTDRYGRGDRKPFHREMRVYSEDPARLQTRLVLAR